MTKMGAIAHFFSEDVGRIILSGDMFNINSPILNPFTSQVFKKFNVTGSFGGHVIGPMYTCLIVIVDDRRSVERGK